MKKPELVSDWRSAWKFISVNMMALAASLQVTYLSLPEEMQASISPEILSIVTTFLMAAGMAGRVIKQPVKQGREEGDDLGV